MGPSSPATKRRGETMETIRTAIERVDEITMIAREHIAEEMMMDCPEETLEVHQELANMIGAGVELDELLMFAARHNLSETYAWIKQRFADISAEVKALDDMEDCEFEDQ